MASPPPSPALSASTLSESPGEIRCEITNSYHPKSVADKSGSGIGLEQVRKRLELTYPGHYDWQQGVSEDMKEYKSILYYKDMNLKLRHCRRRAPRPRVAGKLRQQDPVSGVGR